MMRPDRLLTTTLREHPEGQLVTQVLASALHAVEPGAAVRAFLRRDGDLLWVADQSYDLQQIVRLWVVGAGKAGAPMAVAAADVLEDRLTAGVVLVKEGHISPEDQQQSGAIALIEAGHPIPDARGVAGAERMAALLAEAGERDLVLALISGGGSALLTYPEDGITLADLQQLTAVLLACGATINEINTLRKHLDRVKGGGLARLAAPARVATLVLSDVIGDPLDVIASGPTVPDTSSFADALEILKRYEIIAQVPQSVLARLQQGAAGALPDTPKPGDLLFARVQNVVIGSNRQAALAALAQARQAGMQTLLLTTSLQGEARDAAAFLASVAREIAASGHPLTRPACVVAGGETTVTLRGTGRGGRNQELALGSVALLAEIPGSLLVALATDGGDGPTDAAGAVVSHETLARAQALGLDPAAFLADNNAYPFFAALGDLLLPGPTQTNVNDLTFLFLW